MQRHDTSCQTLVSRNLCVLILTNRIYDAIDFASHLLHLLCDLYKKNLFSQAMEARHFQRVWRHLLISWQTSSKLDAVDLDRFIRHHTLTGALLPTRNSLSNLSRRPS